MSLETFFILFVLVMVVWRVIRHLKAKKKQTVRLISNGRIIEVVPLVVFEPLNCGQQDNEDERRNLILDDMDEDLQRHRDLADAAVNPANPSYFTINPRHD